MKNLIVGAILLFSVLSFAQKKNNTAVKTNKLEITDSVEVSKPKFTKYIAFGLGISSGNRYDTNENAYTFEESSFPSVEIGVARKNLMVGLSLGRGNLKDMASNNDKIGNYYWEVRVTPSFPLGIIDANVVFGAGSYFTRTLGTFIEYGSGISYTKGDYTYGIGYSNWDGVDYITPSISYTF